MTPESVYEDLAESGLKRIKVVVLGAPGVGKTSIINQFVRNTYNDEYKSTASKAFYYPSVIINNHLYEIKILDSPVIPYFPSNSLNEWADFRGYGLRTAAAYILVFDITNDESFQYVKMIYEQIQESRDMHDIPIFVVGNKHDLSADRNMSKREVANTVKKQWKSGYIECSAKYNWHIMFLFKEMMRAIDFGDCGHKSASDRMHDAFRRNSCVIL